MDHLPTPTPGLVPAVSESPRLRLDTAIAAVLWVFALARLVEVLWLIPDPGIDFGTFYASAAEWVGGRAPYPPHGIDPPNLTPPVMLLVFAPFTYLPVALARAVWDGWSLLCVGATVWVARRDIGMLPRDVLVILLAATPTALALALGQVSCSLMLVMTLGWIEMRRGHYVASGAWLGVLCLLKPFYGLFLVWLVLTRQWRAALALLSVVVGGLVVSLLVVGSDGVQMWLTLMRRITWQAHIYNASINGVGARLFSTATDLPAATWTPVLVSDLARLTVQLALMLIVVWLAVRAVRGTGERVPLHRLDTVFAALSAAGILLSPLAWIHYVPVAAAPTIAVFSRKPVWWGLLALAIVAFPFQWLINHHYSVLGTLTVGQWSFSLAMLILAATAAKAASGDSSASGRMRQ